ncbi:FAD dependent oxidoreductase [Hyaloscypha variabilis F]|uniref:FAD dependent oxidoreductase n=1 Tax=Hyaloscypha variabilis (strain UAMH 11265 / GT02V1 / F) TaxID=1149755 RepID=A0A2J6SCB0_HYAVF|nr:FAD dependent oxidoreductase [Hyaloscypha variabilis F]
MAPLPSSILIVGSGVFGLSTALALSTRPSFKNTRITLLDRSPFPSPDGSSIDTSRIIRADYSSAAYASLAASAQETWRQQGDSELGGQGRYSECGLVLVADKGKQGEKYVRESLENVKNISASQGVGLIQELKTRKEIDAAVGTGGGSGDWGYINTVSGWADAEEGMKWLRRKAEATGRISFVTGQAISLLKNGTKVLGATLKSGPPLLADITILATGAWTSSLVDLRGRATATGQVLCYLPLSASEQERLGKMPVLLNMSTGMFIIPPKNQILKVARHGYGYSNPTSIPNPSGNGEKIDVSIPRTTLDDPTLWVPREGEAACRQALREMIPELAERPFTKSKICWYTDTPDGDFLIDWHPGFEGLFLATGGSGHGYKFLPVIGERIVDVVEGREIGELRGKWRWREKKVENVVTEDGSRGGRPGMVLEEEWRKGSKL